MAKETPSFLISIRFLLAVVGFFGYATQYTQKINMSVGIVCMINNSALDDHSHLSHHSLNQSYPMDALHQQNVSEDSCGGGYSKKKGIDGPFIWSKNIQGMILASYFIGYLITEIPGGWLSLKFGSKLVLAGALFSASIFTIILPFAARLSYIALIACRFLIGLAHGVIWPAFSGFWAAWAPPTERSRLIGLANAGSQIGNVIALPLGGFLCINGFDGGWPSIFYIFGIVGLVWTVIWMIFASNLPSEHRFIGNKERDYIEEETRETIEAHKEGESGAPWGKIMTSKACIAIFIGHSCSNWGTYLFLTSLPSYMKEVLKFDIKSNGALSALPYLMFWLFIILSGIIGDKMIQSFNVEKTKVRKIFNTLGLIVPMLAVIGLVFVTCSVKYVGVALLTTGLAFTGCAYGAGFLVNYNDVAGAFSGIAFGIGNTFATIPGIMAPYLVGIITKNKTQQEWQIVFVITAVVYLVGAIILLLFTNGEVEPWACKQKTKEEIPLNPQKA